MLTLKDKIRIHRICVKLEQNKQKLLNPKKFSLNKYDQITNKTDDEILQEIVEIETTVECNNFVNLLCQTLYQNNYTEFKLFVNQTDLNLSDKNTLNNILLNTYRLWIICSLIESKSYKFIDLQSKTIEELETLIDTMLD